MNFTLASSTLSTPLFNGRPHLRPRKHYGWYTRLDSSGSSLKDAWPSISFSLFGSGFFLGPLLDGLHSRASSWFIRMAPSISALFTPTFGALGLFIELSAEMSKAGVPDNIEAYNTLCIGGDNLVTLGWNMAGLRLSFFGWSSLPGG